MSKWLIIYLTTKPLLREMAEGNDEYDLFMSYSHADSKAIVEPLVGELEAYGLDVWHDSVEVGIGDSIRESIDEGLSASNHAVTVLSENYFEGTSEWELNGIVNAHNREGNVILPLWFGIDHDDVYEQSASLADIRAETVTTENIGEVATDIYRAVEDGSEEPSGWGQSQTDETEEPSSWVDVRIRFQEHVDPDIGTPVTILSWYNHNAPKVSKLEATKLRDEERGLEYTSRSHGTTMSLQRIDDEPIEGRVSEVHSISSNKVEFNIRVEESRMDALPRDRDYYRML